MINITGGRLKGRKIKVILKDDLRPTSSKIRDALFEQLDNLIDFEEYSFFDLFAGSGIMGIEAASRGFKKVICIESDTMISKQLRKNIDTLDLLEQIKIIQSDTLKYLLKLKRKKKSVFFLDPPYNSLLLTEALDIMQKRNYLVFDDIIITESKKSQPNLWDKPLNKIISKVYGNTAIQFFKIED